MTLETPKSPVSKKSLSLAEQVERMRVTLSEGVDTWSEMLDIPKSDYELFQKGRKDLSILALSRLADTVDLSLENIMQGKIDYQVLAARKKGDALVLPERFQVGARSRRRSSMNLLAATEEFLGWKVRAMAMRHLQVTEAAFQNLDDVINLHFNTDLCNYLQKNFVENHLFYQMGAYSIINNLSSPVGVALSKCRSVPEVYQTFIEQIVGRHWEQNFHYRIVSMTPTTMRAEGIPNPDVSDSLRIKNPGSEAVCQTKVGIVSSIPGYLGLPFAHVEEVSCVHRGDDRCVYEVDFEAASRQMFHQLGN